MLRFTQLNCVFGELGTLKSFITSGKSTPIGELHTSVNTFRNTSLVSKSGENTENEPCASPEELFIASLASCTVATMQMYTQMKKWEDISFHVQVEYIRPKHTVIEITKTIFIDSKDRTPDEIERIYKISKKCPFHVIIDNSTSVTMNSKLSPNPFPDP